MNKKLLIPGLVLIIVMAVLTLFYYPPVDKEPVVDPENSRLYSALASVGLEDAVVEITPERTLIRYNLPENMSKEAVQYYIMGATATIAPNSNKMVIQTYEDFEPVEEVTAETKYVVALMNESMTLEEFQATVKTKFMK